MCTSRPSTEDQHEVTIGDKGFMVNIKKGSCTCGFWLLNGIPCCHAFSSITYLRGHPEDFVDEYFLMNRVKSAYMHPIPPSEGRQAWLPVEGYKVYPPQIRRMPGRPKTKRKRETWEVTRKPSRDGNGKIATRHILVITCTNCGKDGHNKRNCKNPRKPPEPPKKKSRAAQPRTQGNVAADQNTTNEPKQRKKNRYSKCSSEFHNVRRCPMNVGIQAPHVGSSSRHVTDREMRMAMCGIGTYIDEATGNMYARMSTRVPGAGGHVQATAPDVPAVGATQPPATQPETP
ncbi:unnamed protein product [Linum tenue]|uniref:SWIM-type domain-containing protein n=1 Tax=Linum tenue TaxID=586396 RepID=A0AAV0NU02_9ROSI|nr:unnamed protein product [Linum tenue]